MVKDSLKMIEEARAEGVDVLCDQYPYIASATSLTSIIRVGPMKAARRLFSRDLGSGGRGNQGDCEREPVGRWMGRLS